MQRYLVATLNTQDDIDAMNGYSGVELIKTDSDFAVWYCANMSQNDLETINMTGMIMLNRPE